MLLFAAPSLEKDQLSLILSALICVLVVIIPSSNGDLLAPPQLMASLALLFFPVFSLFYLQVSELGKWYQQFFSVSDFSHSLAVTTYFSVLPVPLFQLGFLMGQLREDTVPRVAQSRQFVPTGVGIIMLVAAICLGFLGMLAYALSIGGIDAVLNQMSSIASRREWRESSSPFYYVGMALMTAPSVLALTMIYNRKGITKIACAIVLMLLAAAFLIVTQASREKAVLPLILFILSLWLQARGEEMKRFGLLLRVVVVSVVVALVLGFTVMAVFRAGGSGSLDFWRFLRDFNRMDVSMVMFTEYFADQSGNDLLWGMPFLAYPSRILGRFFGFSPIQNASEILQGIIFSGSMDAGNPGAPLAGELYINFGYLGFLAFIPLGAWFGVAYTRMIRRGYPFWQTLFFSAFLYFFVFKFYIYTGFTESELVFALVIVPLAIWRLLLRVRI